MYACTCAHTAELKAYLLSCLVYKLLSLASLKQLVGNQNFM